MRWRWRTSRRAPRCRSASASSPGRSPDVRPITGTLPLLWLLLAPLPALAGWAIELRGGGSVLATSYKVEGDKIVAYRPAGALVLERAHVKAIRETDREPGAAGPVVTQPPAAASVAARPA